MRQVTCQERPSPIGRHRLQPDCQVVKPALHLKDLTVAIDPKTSLHFDQLQLSIVCMPHISALVIDFLLCSPPSSALISST